MPDVCIYEPVPVAEVMPGKTALETLAFRLLPTLIAEWERRGQLHANTSRLEVCRMAFDWAETFLRVAKEYQ